MSLFEGLKLLHVSCAFISIAGFSLRGYWMVSDNSLLQHRPAKVLPVHHLSGEELRQRFQRHAPNPIGR